jgi:nucleotide-binding universal stress UspA family protein
MDSAVSALKIVTAAIDNSAAARPVLLAARAWAAALGTDVEAIHVADDGGQTARGCADACGIPYTELRGDPLRAIVALAASDEVAAVVLGARGAPSQRRAGHLARAVANRISKPVLVVPPDAVLRHRMRTILIAVKDTPASALAARTVVRLASNAHLGIVAVHVDDEATIPRFSDHPAYDTEQYVSEFLARYLPDATNARLELRVGVPADDIIAVSEAIAADALALGWPQSTDAARGRVAHEVLDRSHVPVLLVALAETLSVTPCERDGSTGCRAPVFLSHASRPRTAALNPHDTWPHRSPVR